MVKPKHDPKFDELLRHFGSMVAISNYFNVTHQAVQQWRDKVPEARYREFVLLRQMQRA